MPAAVNYAHWQEFEPLQPNHQQLRPARTLPTQYALLVAGLAAVLDRCLLVVPEV
ncbi:hypothetical protein [Nostoc sp.]|uniref:hypothetical protein n=1 Tax=Nostoc sp. TaxID=1180 RepID=UPI002FFACEF8